MRFACLFALTLWWPAMHAQAQPRLPANLAWDAPAGCPNLEALRQAIDRWLRESVEPVDARALSVRARVKREGEGWQLGLVLESPSGRTEEQYDAQTCPPLLEVVALKVAYAASTAAALQEHAAPAPAADSGVRAALRTTVGGALGRLPGLSATFGLAGALEIASVRFELGVSYAPPRAARYGDFPSIGADFQLASGSARVCAAAARGAVELPVCAGVELGLIHGSGFGVRRQFAANMLFGEAVLATALRWPWTRVLSAWLEFGASLAFERPGFEMEGNPEQLFRPALLAARVLLGLELQL